MGIAISSISSLPGGSLGSLPDRLARHRGGVTDAAGHILSRGRNRVPAGNSLEKSVNHNDLSNAELNALLALDSRRIDRRSCVLYTTTEPCPLCLGAFYMSGLRNLHYASRDPYAGNRRLLAASTCWGRHII